MDLFYKFWYIFIITSKVRYKW